MIRRRRGVVLALVAVLLAGCSSLENWGDSVTRAFNGVSATMTTYSADGAMVDRIHGKSFRISRDERFDTTDDDGKSNEDSSVLLISLGDSHISHVGSTLLLVEDGILDVSDLIPAEAFRELGIGYTVVERSPREVPQQLERQVQDDHRP